jgi:ribonuclease P/MRP protein subunit RPP40
MLDIHRTDDTPAPKVYFTHSVLPSYIDPHNVSTKKFPFSTFNAQPYSHTVDLILPAELYLLVQDTLATATYARTHLKLTDILEPEFLETYIKLGNVTMLSEGRELVDNRLELRDGKLKMELDRATYERCGLQGTPIEDGGKKHQKARWVVEYDLRLPSMKHGKAGFGRLEWAAKNVLNKSLTWLWWNHNPTSGESLAEGREVISKHAPWIHKIEPSVTKLGDSLCPKLVKGELDKVYDENEAMSLLEYINMLSLNSPRVKATDNIDPHLSRYEVPDFGVGLETRDMVCVRWKGFMPPAFMRDVFIAARRDVFRSNGRSKTNGTQGADVDMEGAEQAKEEEAWFAMSAQGFGGRKSWTVMQFEGRDTVTWQVESR